MPGSLYYGDNLHILRNEVASESVDLVYLDPPFNSDRTYTLLHRESGARERAFLDSWQWDEAAERAYAELTGRDLPYVRAPRGVREYMRTLRDFLGDKHRDTMAYLSMMAVRLVEMRRVLRPTGSLYLHCDPTASHYLKLMLDAIFGADCFRNEIIWRYRRWPTKAHRFQRMHDVLLFYTARAGVDHTFHTLYGYEKLADSTLKTFGTKKQRADFSSGHRKPSVERGDTRGPPLSDFWDVGGVDDRGLPQSDTWEVGVIAPIGRERTGFPTQKPEKLLERVILASSNEGDLVLDPFCGSGTSLVVAERLRRRWLGVDMALRALDVTKDRLDKAFPSAPVWREHGEPSDAESATRLAEANPYDFRWWAVRKLGGRPPRAGAGGSVQPCDIHGEMTVRDLGSDREHYVIISVHSEQALTPERVKAFASALDLARADAGILLTTRAPSREAQKAARDCAARASERSRRQHVPRIQIVTLPELLGGGLPRLSPQRSAKGPAKVTPVDRDSVIVRARA